MKEHYIEIPLSEYRQVIEDRKEAMLLMSSAIEDTFKLKVELDEMKNAHAKLSDAYEQVVAELESYKRAYDYNKEDQ